MTCAWIININISFSQKDYAECRLWSIYSRRIEIAGINFESILRKFSTHVIAVYMGSCQCFVAFLSSHCELLLLVIADCWSKIKWMNEWKRVCTHVFPLVAPMHTVINNKKTILCSFTGQKFAVVEWRSGHVISSGVLGTRRTHVRHQTALVEALLACWKRRRQRYFTLSALRRLLDT